MPRLITILILLFVGTCTGKGAGISQTNFVNFETAPVHPIALSPDGLILAVCNLPDGRVEFFKAASLEAVGSVPVGIDPVSLRFRTSNEVWVVNHVSDSINIVDSEKGAVTRVISTRDGPADVVFAGNPQRAFVSCPSENVVLVIDPETRSVLRSISIPAERPKALAVSPDGKTVYVAILESGNGTTILAPRMTELQQFPSANPVDLFVGPHGGLNPPPNDGTNFVPVINTNIPLSNVAPRVSLIVKKNAEGRWFDDNQGDWTEFVSGTNAALSGRVEGWDLIDHDLIAIDTQTFELSFVDRLMNICFDVAVNPVSGKVAVIGTEALNQIRYEPKLRGVFTRVQLALVAENEPIILDANPHLDYATNSISIEQRQRTLGDPRGLVWNPQGTRLYASGMGSDNIAMFDQSGRRLKERVVEGGPTGMVMDAKGKRLFVLNRFSASVQVLDAETLETVDTEFFFDPTPGQIRKGRHHFYNTIKNSGLGLAACASCHVDGRFDRLAWDLGTPAGEMKQITSLEHNFGAFPPAVTNHYHPMKGPMVTQTLQDIIGHEPFHWRGDRNGIEEFNPTFPELQAADRELTETEMQEFEDFLATITFPPNRFRSFDNSLPRNVALPGQLALGRDIRLKGTQLPNGDAVAGLNFFNSSSCRQCHSLPAGLGSEQIFRSGRWNTIPVGPKGEHHVALVVTERSEELPFKVPHLRNMSEKLGLTFGNSASSGFGFFHDGRVDSLTRLLQDGFGLRSDKQTADVIAFLLAFSGSDFPATSAPTNPNIAPDGRSRDVPAAVGRQLLTGDDTFDLNQWFSRANSLTGRVEMVVKGRMDGRLRGWLYQRSTLLFLGDSAGAAALSRTELFANKDSGTDLLFMLVPAGTGRRLGIDRDLDGVLDFDDVQTQLSARAAVALRLTKTAEAVILSHAALPGQVYRLLAKEKLSQPDWDLVEAKTAAETEVEFVFPFPLAEQQRFFIIEVRR